MRSTQRRVCAARFRHLVPALSSPFLMNHIKFRDSACRVIMSYEDQPSPAVAFSPKTILANLRWCYPLTFQEVITLFDYLSIYIRYIYIYTIGVFRRWHVRRHLSKSPGSLKGSGVWGQIDRKAPFKDHPADRKVCRRRCCRDARQLSP